MNQCEYFIPRLHRKCKLMARLGYMTCHRHQNMNVTLQQPCSQQSIHHTTHSRLQKPDECIVCLENVDKMHKPLECGHWIHTDCIVKSGKNNCPICRAPVKLSAHLNRQMEMYSLDIRQYNDDDYIFEDIQESYNYQEEDEDDMLLLYDEYYYRNVFKIAANS